MNIFKCLGFGITMVWYSVFILFVVVLGCYDEHISIDLYGLEYVYRIF